VADLNRLPPHLRLQRFNQSDWWLPGGDDQCHLNRAKIVLQNGLQMVLSI